MYRHILVFKLMSYLYNLCKKIKSNYFKYKWIDNKLDWILIQI